MALIPWKSSWDPFHEMEDMMNRFPSVMSSEMKKSFTPALDMYENDNEVVIEMPLAGIDPENIEVSVEKGILTIKGESKKEHEMEEKNYYRREVRSGAFFRQISLPLAVEEDHVSAEFDGGMLQVHCPKAAPAKAKKIDVAVKKKK